MPSAWSSWPPPRHQQKQNGCFEYRGDDVAADLAPMADDPPAQEWWRRRARRVSTPSRRPHPASGGRP
ncbi:hypothetical protein L1I79_17050 [Strepomyces sp. STD 3.1]|nr:hypothetical protein [Streptomyces sp. STD 3.1]